MSDVLAIYNKVKNSYSKIDMPVLDQGALTVKDPINYSLSEYKSLLETIDQFKPDAGWLSYQSKNIRYRNGEDLIQNQSYGYLLQGELVKGDISLHIKSNGRGGWIVNEISYQYEAAELGLIENVSFLAMPENESDSEGYLNYQLYWKKDDCLGYRQEQSRFTGFSSTRGEK